MQNQKISELYTDDNKSKHFSNPKDKKVLLKTLHQGGSFQSSTY